MKKIFIISSILILFALCSCSNKATREIIRDHPEATIFEDLQLSSVQEGKSLNPNIDKTNSYTDVLIAEDTKSSLFYQTIDLDEYINDRFKQINLKVLYFNDRIPSTDATAFITEMNNSEYGLSEEKIGYTFRAAETNSECAVLFEKLSLSYGIKLPTGFSNQEDKQAQLVVVYLPTFCIYNDGTQDYTKVFVFVPVYYAFTYDSDVENYTEGLKHYPLVLTENNLLPSEEE